MIKNVTARREAKSKLLRVETRGSLYKLQTGGEGKLEMCYGTQDPVGRTAAIQIELIV